MQATQCPHCHATFHITDEARPLPEAMEEPDFVKRGRHQERVGRTIQGFMLAATFILLIVLFAQSAYILRNHIAAWFPTTKSSLVNACATIGCQISLPMQIKELSIESNELQSLGQDKNTFELSVLLRNNSLISQAWPHISLTLNDANKKIIVVRVLKPLDFSLSKQTLLQGIPPQSEQAINLYFSLSQYQASDYRVRLLYP